MDFKSNALGMIGDTDNDDNDDDDGDDDDDDDDDGPPVHKEDGEYFGHGSTVRHSHFSCKGR